MKNNPNPLSIWTFYGYTSPRLRPRFRHIRSGFPPVFASAFFSLSLSLSLPLYLSVYLSISVFFPIDRCTLSVGIKYPVNVTQRDKTRGFYFRANRARARDSRARTCARWIHARINPRFAPAFNDLAFCFATTSSLPSPPVPSTLRRITAALQVCRTPWFSLVHPFFSFSFFFVHFIPSRCRRAYRYRSVQTETREWFLVRKRSQITRAQRKSLEKHKSIWYLHLIRAGYSCRYSGVLQLCTSARFTIRNFVGVNNFRRKLIILSRD
jgi:hypothetical protein